MFLGLLTLPRTDRPNAKCCTVQHFVTAKSRVNSKLDGVSRDLPLSLQICDHSDGWLAVSLNQPCDAAFFARGLPPLRPPGALRRPMRTRRPASEGDDVAGEALRAQAHLSAAFNMPLYSPSLRYCSQ